MSISVDGVWGSDLRRRGQGTGAGGEGLLELEGRCLVLRTKGDRSGAPSAGDAPVLLNTTNPFLTIVVVSGTSLIYPIARLGIVPLYPFVRVCSGGEGGWWEIEKRGGSMIRSIHAVCSSCAVLRSLAAPLFGACSSMNTTAELFGVCLSMVWMKRNSANRETFLAFVQP